MALTGGGAHRLLAHYFETSTDLALKHTLARQLRLLEVPVPPDLMAAEEIWAERGGPWFVPGFFAGPRQADVRRHDDEEEREERSHLDPYDPELAAIFILPLGRDGRVLLPPGSPGAPLQPSPEAVAAAMTVGQDLRTTRLEDGTRARVLIYRLPGEIGPSLLLVGRTLADRDRLLQQLLAGLLALGTGSAVLLGAGSWWMAGRTLRPMQQAWERQQTFVANASHELRTPLTLMRASAEVALRGLAGDDDRQALLKDVLRECDHMGRLVEDLLLLSRLDAGHVALEQRAVPVAHLLDDVQRQVGRLAQQRGVHLDVKTGPGIVCADPTRLRQVLLILLDNALRHTPSGGRICLEARPSGRRVEIVVADDGDGIPPEHLPHVFDRFYRAAARPSGERDGSGLGLSIAKALIEAQGGTVRLTSQLGQGTEVTITLPAGDTMAPAGGEDRPRQRPGR